MQFHLCFTGQTGPWSEKPPVFTATFGGSQGPPGRAPRGLQEASLQPCPQEAPKIASGILGRIVRGLLPPRRPHEAPKRPPRGHQEAPRGPQELTHAHTCSHILTHPHTSSHMVMLMMMVTMMMMLMTPQGSLLPFKRASRSMLRQVYGPSRFSCVLQWFSHILVR